MTSPAALTPEQAAMLTLCDQQQEIIERLDRIERAIRSLARRCEATCEPSAESAKGKGRSRATDSGPKSTRSQGDQA